MPTSRSLLCSFVCMACDVIVSIFGAEVPISRLTSGVTRGLGVVSAAWTVFNILAYASFHKSVIGQKLQRMCKHAGNAAKIEKTLQGRGLC